MDCCLAKKYEDCWQCSEVDKCEKFDILQTRCGELPQNNIKKSKTNGIQDWIESRDTLYIWQK